MLDISVIVPVYKVEKYLKQCIDSIINQTFKNIEIILVDDGSPDSCGVICDKYSKIDSRIKVIHKKNGGLSSARNAGINASKGKYIAFVDSDDYTENTMYEKLYKLIEKYQADIVQCKYSEVSEEGKLINSSINTKDIKVIDKNEALNNIYSVRYIETVVAWNKLYKRSLFSDIKYPEGKIHEDEFIIHKLLYKCNKVVLYDEHMYYYRKIGTSIMNRRFNEKRLDKLLAVRERLDFFETNNEMELYKKTLNFYKDLLIVYYFMVKGSSDDNRESFKVIKHYYRNIFKKYVGNTKGSLTERAMSCIFYIKPEAYYKIQKLRNKTVI